MRKRGELRAAEAAPWRYTKSQLPELTPGTLDAATLLKSVNDALLPLVQKELEEATEKLSAVLTDKETEADFVAVLRAELMRRVLPQFTEAVRKGVLESIRTRQMHLAQLAVLHRQALDAKTLKVVLTRLEDETAKAGLRIVGDTGDQALFNVVEDQPGVMKRGPVTFELVAPAYVDAESGKLVERGWLRAVAKVPRGDMTPGQRHRATHAQADRKQPEKKAPAQRKKKFHRGQDPERRRNTYNEQPTGEARPRSGGKGDSPKRRGGGR
ncbi:hypothetical protein ACPCAG_00230 [Streptomyces pseudogriseolus]|uniref:hypothetical protein n=1 Tax=Streptomyces pseudogriseolus TaxID=36817 RepID=UPI003FA1F889